MKAEEEPKRFFFRFFGVWQKKVTKNYLQLRNFNVKYPQEKLVLNSEMNFSQNYKKLKESQTNEKDDCDAAGWNVQ